jgi:hypothetical protein
MSVANLLWGTPHIHGELLKLGIDVGQTTVAKYMARRRRPPSQGWKTSLHNHADALTAIDMFAVPTISFGLLYALVILRQSRRELLWLGVTAHPNAEWLARQLTLQLERASKLLDPRSRRGVWRCVHAARCSDGHPGSTDLSAVAVAEWIRREADRFDPTGMSFSCYAVSDIFATFSRRIKAASPVCSSLSSRRGQLLPREYGLDNAVVRYPSSAREIMGGVIEHSGTATANVENRTHIVAGRDRRAATPAQARHFLDVMRGLSGGFHPWTEDDVARYEARWPIGSKERVWVGVLLYTGFYAVAMQCALAGSASGTVWRRPIPKRMGHGHHSDPAGAR